MVTVSRPAGVKLVSSVTILTARAHDVLAGVRDLQRPAVLAARQPEQLVVERGRVLARKPLAAHLVGHQVGAAVEHVHPEPAARHLHLRGQRQRGGARWRPDRARPSGAPGS